MDKFVAMNIKMAQGCALVILRAASEDSSLVPVVTGSDRHWPAFQQAARTSAACLEEMAKLLKRFQDSQSDYEKCWKQCAKYIEMTSGEQSVSKYFTLEEAEKKSVIEALNSLNQETATLLSHYRSLQAEQSFWSRLFHKTRTCAACHKKLRPFPVPGGMWTGTVQELQDLKMEADHGFVCEKCGKTICPVCLGKKAGEIGVRAFVCTECGHQPLRTIYR